MCFCILVESILQLCIGVASKGECLLLNVGGQTDCLLTQADGVKSNRRDRTRNFSLQKRRTNHLHHGTRQNDDVTKESDGKIWF